MLLTPRLCRSSFLLLLAFCSYAFLKDVSGIPSHWMPNDKLMHALVFFALMLLWQAGFAGRVLLGMFSLTLYGGLVELAQHHFTNRLGDWWDWLADISGVLLAALLWRWSFQHWWRQWQSS